MRFAKCKACDEEGLVWLLVHVGGDWKWRMHAPLEERNLVTAVVQKAPPDLGRGGRVAMATPVLDLYRAHDCEAYWERRSNGEVWDAALQSYVLRDIEDEA